MKQYRLLLLLALCVLLLSGCQSQQPTQQQTRISAPAPLTIQPAILNQDERRLLDLVGATDLIFTYNVNDELKSASVCCYQLDENNQWQLISGGGQYNVSSAQGRLALNFNTLADGIRACFQSENGAISASRKNVPQQTVLPEDMAWQTFTAEQQPIQYEREIPLVIQCAMPKNEFTAYDVSDFNHPERFTQQGLHQVYALTVRFSRNQLGNNPLPDEDVETEEAIEE